MLPVLFTCLVNISFGQTVKKAQQYLGANQLEKAKTEIDAVLAKNSKDGEAIYLKSKIYGQIASTPEAKALVQGDAREISFEAFKAALADSTNMKVKLELMKDKYQPAINLYSGYYEDAAKAFNDAASNKSKEGFKDAMNLFIKANNVGQYLRENEIASLGEVDTTLVLNIGKAAVNAEDDAAAIEYFSKLADAKINSAANTDDESFVLPYQWLVTHYKDKKDEANMLKYAALANEAFPKDAYTDFVVIDYFRDKKDMPSVLKKYEAIVKAHPDSLAYRFNYANDIFGYIYNSDEGVVVQNKPELLNILKTQLDAAIKLNANDVNTNWLYSQYYYNKGIEQRDEAIKIKGTKPEDVKQKADLNAESASNFKLAIPYGEKALSLLEQTKLKSFRSNYKSIANLMQNIYQSLNDKNNLKVYEDKYDAADKDFVN